MIKKLSAVGAAAAVSVALAAPAANADKPAVQCNAGRGNGSELVRVGHHLVDCDPGNSAGHNNGGD